jgi:peptide/nickel transport system permease protein
MLARVAYGAQHSLAISFGAVFMGFILGGLLGLIAGYVGGKADTVLTAMMDILLAFPALVLALTLVIFLKNQEVGPFLFTPQWVLVVALGLVSIPLLGRITRANTLTWAQREFVLAAKAQGATTSRIIFREILPNVLPSMLAIALLGVGVAMIAEAGLAVLGVGTPLPTPSWGNMIADGRSNLSDAPYIVFIPSFMIFFSVLSLNYLGDVIRDRFDVRESAL